MENLSSFETAIIGLIFSVIFAVSLGIGFGMANSHQCKLEAIKAKLPAAEILLICR